MNKAQALEYLNAEQQMLEAGHTSNLFAEAISILSDASSNDLENNSAFEILNSIYWDESILLMDRNEFGQAVFCLSYNVDPSRPYPVKK